MKPAYLTLALIVSNCLAANFYPSKCLVADNSNSSRREQNTFSNKNNNILDDLQAENNDELKFYVDFDVAKYTAGLERQYISIQQASLMSTDELKKLETDSSQGMIKTNFNVECEMSIHSANFALAKLLLQSRQSFVSHSAIDSWIDSGLSASQFIVLVNEYMQEHSDDWKHRIEFLAIDAMRWHESTGLYYKDVKGEEYTYKHHLGQKIAIDFIYRTKYSLNSSDNAELDRCISIKSPYSISKLAKRIAASNEYSRENIKYIYYGEYSSDYDNVFSDKITLMAYIFNETVRLAWRENDLMDLEQQLQGPGVAFDVEMVMNSRDGSGIVNAYEKCISDAADESADKKCSETLHYLWQISLHKHNLELLISRFDVSTSSQHTSQHENVVVPAFLLINCNTFLRKYDNSEFMEKLNGHQFHSYEDALKGKSKLRQVDGELYNRLIMIEKCRDYVQHKDDIAYIRKDFAHLKRKCKEGDGLELVGIIVHELDEDRNNQRCFYDRDSKMLVFNTLKSQETLMRIFKNKQASRMFIEFCLNVVSGISLPKSIALFDVQANTSENKIWAALRPPFCL